MFWKFYTSYVYSFEYYLQNPTYNKKFENHILEISLIVKPREREGQRVDLGRSLKGHL